jgi:hypothetical protein
MLRAWTPKLRSYVVAAALSWLGSAPYCNADETLGDVTAWLEAAPAESVSADAEGVPAAQPLDIEHGLTEHGLTERGTVVEPGRDPANPFQAPRMTRPDLRRLNPNYIERPEEHDAGFWEFFPEGMWPWSERTPFGDRHTEYGEPLTNTSWLNRPLYAGLFVGAWMGDDLIDGQVGQHTTFLGGYRFGWDYDYYWGTEARLGLATPTLADLEIPNDYRTADVLVTDLNLMYYPWGDSRWRPYASFGLGMGYFIFRDSEDRRFRELMVGMPLAIGVKYRWHEWLVLRADLQDNIYFENAGLSSMCNFSMTGGLEIRFGGHRTHYWPYHPSGNLW